MTKQPSSRRPAATGAAWTTAGLLHTGLWLGAPGLATALILLEAAVTVTVIATALYTPDHISDRAFRMLPWTAPPHPRRERPDESGHPEHATSEIRTPPWFADDF